MAVRRPFSLAPWLVLLLAVLASYVYGPSLRRTGVVLGLFRSSGFQDSIPHGDISAIENTVHCEDLHYNTPSKLLFTACEDEESTRYSWFPPLTNFDDPTAVSKARGSIKVIDPTTLKARTLRFENFESPFVTHGIDVLDDPSKERGEAVYIFAVNHKPSYEYYQRGNLNAPRSRSVIEVFHHVIGSDTLQHLRSVWHPLVTTPNDILAVSPTSFLVTNDHYYRDGWLRTLEDIYPRAKWSNTLHVEFSTDAGHLADESRGVKASVALTGLHNNNGLGHGRTREDVLLVSAASGMLHLGAFQGSDSKINLIESIEMDSTLDNPSYFSDPYANSTFDASGFVVCGLTKAFELLKNSRDPKAKDGVMVWKVTPSERVGQQRSDHTNGGSLGKWSKRLLFQDDGNRIRSSSSALLVAVDPSVNGGRRQAQLFVTGFLSKNAVMMMVDL